MKTNVDELKNKIQSRFLFGQKHATSKTHDSLPTYPTLLPATDPVPFTPSQLPLKSINSAFPKEFLDGKMRIVVARQGRVESQRAN